MRMCANKGRRGILGIVYGCSLYLLVLLYRCCRGELYIPARASTTMKWSLLTRVGPCETGANCAAPRPAFRHHQVLGFLPRCGLRHYHFCMLYQELVWTTCSSYLLLQGRHDCLATYRAVSPIKLPIDSTEEDFILRCSCSTATYTVAAQVPTTLPGFSFFKPD